MNRDLVLQARLAMVRSSLATVQRVLKDLDSARHIHGGAHATELDLVDAVRAAVKRLREVNDLSDARIEAIARDLDDAATKRVAERDAEAVAIQRRLTLGGTSVDEALAEEVKERLEDLGVIERRMVESDGDDDLGASLGRAWNEYGVWQETCVRVFTDYVDLVRGVLLRDAGLDNDLCRIADELVRLSGTWKFYKWESFTIPAGDDQGDLSSLHLVRIGFPEWSVWALPLTMYEIGFVFADVHPKMRDIVHDTRTAAGDRERGAAKDDGASEEETALRVARAGADAAALCRTWIADAYATAVLGPTYAWALMLLRADPRSDRDDQRIAVMLEMLRAIDAQPGARGTDAFADERERIKSEWAAARGQVRTQAVAATISPAITDVVEAVRFRLKVPFTAADWDYAVGLADDLEGDADPQDIAAPLTSLHLRHVLGAACTARIRLADTRFEPPADLEGDQLAQSRTGFDDFKRDRSRTLAERTRAICIAIIDGPEEPPTRPPEGPVTSSFPPNNPERHIDKTRYVPASAGQGA